LIVGHIETAQVSAEVSAPIPNQRLVNDLWEAHLGSALSLVLKGSDS
jgi:hypothetical protein